LFIIKRVLEGIMMFPFILLGRLIAMARPLDKEYEIFFLFPFYHVGGAEKVHAHVAQALGNERCIMFFTRRSHNNLFYDRFAAAGCTMKDISKYTDNKLIYFVNIIFRGIITGYINRQKQRPVVFNGQCNFAYKISPWVRKDIPQIELIHSYSSFSWIRLPFLPFITRTVMIAQVRIEDHLRQYKRLGVPSAYGQRIQYIGNGIEISKEPLSGNYNNPGLQVLYVGRGTAEKRVHLIAQMAEKLHANDPDIIFLFLGDTEQAIPQHLHRYCQFFPYTSDERKIIAMYDRADVLMITSDTEGFPMVVMEAMMRGCAIVATPVGDLPVHIENNNSGFLFSDVLNEELIVQEGVQFLRELKRNLALREKIAKHNIAYARQNFSVEQFNHSYQELIKRVQ
jgi:glycosyltransferase involved in cell wall biosynthesis